MVAVVGKQGVPGWKVELVNTSVSTPFLFELVAAFEGLTLFLWLAAWIPALVVLYAGLALIIAAAIPGLLSWIDAVVLEAGSNALEGASIPASQTPFFLGATWTQDIRKLGFTQEGAEAHVRLYQNSLVSSLRTNLVLRGLNPAAGLRAISPPVSSVRKLMGS
jgi:hypothetical protein